MLFTLFSNSDEIQKFWVMIIIPIELFLFLIILEMQDYKLFYKHIKPQI